MQENGTKHSGNKYSLYRYTCHPDSTITSELGRRSFICWQLAPKICTVCACVCVWPHCALCGLKNIWLHNASNFIFMLMHLMEHYHTWGTFTAVFHQYWLRELFLSTPYCLFLKYFPLDLVVKVKAPVNIINIIDYCSLTCSWKKPYLPRGNIWPKGEGFCSIRCP